MYNVHMEQTICKFVNTKSTKTCKQHTINLNSNFLGRGKRLFSFLYANKMIDLQLHVLLGQKKLVLKVAMKPFITE